jgi:hypothetical protein
MITDKKQALNNDYIAFEENAPALPDVTDVDDKNKVNVNHNFRMLCSIIATVVCFIMLMLTQNWFFKLINTDSNHGIIKAILDFFGTILLGLIALFFLVATVAGAIYTLLMLLEKLWLKISYGKTKKDYDFKMKIYDEATAVFQADCEKRKEELNEKCRSGDVCISEINTEIDEISNQLEQAYSANIIPRPFRNIQGIYYLYDYLSTSNQSLSEALLQCNLEAIKNKLDNVIKQQGEYIIQQAQANAALYEQNQSILNSLIDLNSKADDLNSKADSIASNTSMAAKYAQISATNSAVSVKLQSQMLSYQKSDYWFK